MSLKKAVQEYLAAYPGKDSLRRLGNSCGVSVATIRRWARGYTDPRSERRFTSYIRLFLPKKEA